MLILLFYVEELGDAGYKCSRKNYIIIMIYLGILLYLETYALLLLKISRKFLKIVTKQKRASIPYAIWQKVSKEMSWKQEET